MKYVWNDKKQKFIPVERKVSTTHFVQSDFEEHGGRARFREYLKANDCIEMGHSDIKAQQEKWESRKSAFRDRLKPAGQYVKPAEMPAEPREYERTRMNAEVRNKLEGRPAPDRKTLIKLTLDVARDLARRRY